MSDSKIDYVSPYAAVAERHKNGLDSIITSIGGGGPGTVTIDQLSDAVYNYLTSVYTNIGSDPQGEENVRALIANAINGYLDNGASSPFLKELQRTPPTTLVNQFDRLFDASVAASTLRGGKSRHQLVLAIGQANTEYWINQISTSGSWTPYLTGDGAIDIAALPFYADAAMFGTHFNFYQNNADDSEAVGSTIISGLAGSLITGAGKVVFGWVPKNVGTAAGPIIVSEECGCNGGGKVLSSEMAQIGRPNGGVGRASNTTWYTAGGSKGGTDYRYYTNKHPCISLHNYYTGGQEHIIGGDDC